MKKLSASEVHTLLNSADEWALFDVREAGEADGGHILGASFLPRRMLESKIVEFVQDRDTKIIVYDEGGALSSKSSAADRGTASASISRAEHAAEALTRAGYHNVHVLDGGLRGWQQAGHEVSSGSNVPSKHFGEAVSHREHVPQLPPTELARWRAEGKPHVVCDIRTPEEYRIAHIPGAIGAFGVDAGLNALDLAARNVPVIVHCSGRTRSIIACQTLRELGVGQAHALEDGTMGWTLAGYELERGPDKAFEPTKESVARTAQKAQSLASQAGVTAVEPDTLRDWLERRARGELNVYLFDVRQVPRFEESHVAGARALPGGLAIQRTDEFIAVKNAHIVLVDDGEARAWITGLWLRRMGFGNVHVLAGGLERWRGEGRGVERGRTRSAPLMLDETRRSTKPITAEALQALLAEDATNKPVAIDVDTSKYYGDRHVPGAHWIPYGSLEMRIAGAAPSKDTPIVVTCHNGVHSAYAAANLERAGYRNVLVLEGGTDQWSKCGMPVDKGLGEHSPDDIVVPPYNSDTKTMARYLEWEKKLTHAAS